MGASRARHVNENATHLPGANGEKMCPALPIDILQIRQAKIELIDKCGGLQRVAVAFVSQA